MCQQEELLVAVKGASIGEVSVLKREHSLGRLIAPMMKKGG